MSNDQAFDTLRLALWVAVKISAPLLLIALVSGLIIGLLQALTSIQEMTLTFVPKVAAIFIVFWASMSFMTSTVVSFFDDTVLRGIVGVGG